MLLPPAESGGLGSPEVTMQKHGSVTHLVFVTWVRCFSTAGFVKKYLQHSNLKELAQERKTVGIITKVDVA